MFTREDLDALASLKTPSPVLSVYLCTNPAEGPPDTHKLHLRSMLEGIDLPEDVQAVENYFDHQYDWKSFRSAVVFSCQEEDFFQAIPLSLEVTNRTKTGRFPYIIPLSDLLDSHTGNGIVLIDQQRARYFVFHLGDLLAEEVFEGEEIQRQKHGGGSQTVGNWRGDEGSGEQIDTIANRNMRTAANRADDFFSRNDIRRVFLGGTEKNISAFRQLLSKRWQSLIAGTFQVDLNIPDQEIQLLISEMVQKKSIQRKEVLLETVITETAKGRHGLLRVDDILGAVREGRVQTLLIGEDYQQHGFQCTSCDYLTAQMLESCPFCGAEFEEIDDLGGLAVRKVLTTGGRVEVLSDSKELSERGGMGALLRY